MSGFQISASAEARFAEAPARLLDEAEELRMNLSNDQLIVEAIEVNHRGVGDEKTLDRYRDHLEHFSHYLASAYSADFYATRTKHVRLFMTHLEKQGGAKPHEARLRCEWCKARGYPDGRSGKGWSASYRKSYLSALRFLYHHFQAEEDLPSLDPTVLESSPKLDHKMGYVLTREEVRRLFEAQGSPKARLIAKWIFYAPSRRATFSDALWTDLDLDLGTWEVLGKGKQVDVFALAPVLVRELRLYKRHQLAEAENNPAMRDALSDPDRAYVLLTANGTRGPDPLSWTLDRWGAKLPRKESKCHEPDRPTHRSFVRRRSVSPRPQATRSAKSPKTSASPTRHCATG